MEAEWARSRLDGRFSGVGPGPRPVGGENSVSESLRASSDHFLRRRRFMRRGRLGRSLTVAMLLTATILLLRSYIICTNTIHFRQLDDTKAFDGSKLRRLAGAQDSAEGEEAAGSDLCSPENRRQAGESVRRQQSLRQLYTQKRAEELSWKGSSDNTAWAVAAREANAASAAALREFEGDLERPWGAARLDWILSQTRHQSLHDLPIARRYTTRPLPPVGSEAMSRAMERLRREQSLDSDRDVPRPAYWQAVVSSMAPGNSSWENRLRERVERVVENEVRRVTCIGWTVRSERAAGASQERTLTHQQQLLASWAPGMEELNETETVIKNKFGAARHKASLEVVRERSRVVKDFRTAVEESERYALKRVIVRLETEMESAARGWDSHQQKEALEERLPWTNEPRDLPPVSYFLMKWLGKGELRSKLESESSSPKEAPQAWWTRFTLNRRGSTSTAPAREPKSPLQSPLHELPFSQAERDVLKTLLPDFDDALPVELPEDQRALRVLRDEVLIKLGEKVLADLHEKKASLHVPRFPRSVDVAALFVENRLSQAF